jgi:hypothetical protein
LNSGLRAAQAGGGIAISGMPANLADLNGTYAPTGQLVESIPAFSAGPSKHLYRHPERDEWHLSNSPFDPAESTSFAAIRAAGDPVPTGARAWEIGVGVAVGGANWVTGEVTAREVA